MSIFSEIKKAVHSVDPSARIILFGSHARGDHNADSDIDVLILLDKDQVTRQDEKRIKYPLYEIEFEHGRIISPLVLAVNEWESKHRITPFYESVMEEGTELSG